MAMDPRADIMQLDEAEDSPVSDDSYESMPPPANRKRGRKHASEIAETESPPKRMAGTVRPKIPTIPQEEQHVDEIDPEEIEEYRDAVERFLEQPRDPEDDTAFDPNLPIQAARSDADLGPMAGWVDEKARDAGDDEGGGMPPTSALELNWSSDDERSLAADEDYDMQTDTQQRVYLPNEDFESDEKVIHINEAYQCLHRFTVEWPCLTFDIVKDQLGALRRRVPYTMYLCVGTQADAALKNQILFLKLSQLQKTKYDDGDASDESDEDEDYDDMTDDQPILQDRKIQHPGGVNRLRCMPQRPHIVATWSEDCNVYIWNGEQHLRAIDGEANDLTQVRANVRPIHSLRNAAEGFALAWSPHNEGWLLTGSCSGELCLLESRAHGWIKPKKFKTPKGKSIEDIAWSPNQPQVFTTVGVDKCIRVWDSRKRKSCVREVKDAHPTDINVVSWNKHQQHLLLTGSDDNSFAVWDMRLFKRSGKTINLAPYAHYAYHSRPITSVEWHPLSASELCVASEDNRITIWDLSAEVDASRPAQGASGAGQEIPPQMMFCHGGQQDIKEIHWHPQIPGMVVSTALSGFHIFKPDNLVDAFENLQI